MDVDNKKTLDEKIAKKFYLVTIAFLCLTILFTLLANFLKQSLFNIGSVCGLLGYVLFGIFSKPKYKRSDMKKFIIPYIISRAVIFTIVLSITIYTIVTL